MHRLVLAFAGLTYHIVENLMSQLISSQLLAYIFEKSGKQGWSWSAGFWEASWSESTLFSKQDIKLSRFIGLKHKYHILKCHWNESPD